MRSLLLLVFVAGVFSASAKAEMRLVSEVNGQTVPVTALEDGQIVGLDGSQKTIFPKDTVFTLEGNLGANANVVLWSPSYGIHRSEIPERSKKEKALVGSVGIRHMTEWAGQKTPSALLKAWPAGVPNRALIVLGWLVNGKLTQIYTGIMPSTLQTKFALVSHEFELTPAEAEGQGVVLLWMDGKFVAPTARFPDPVAEHAFQAMLLGDLGPLRAALEQGWKATTRGRQKITMLHLAAEAGLPEAVELLVARGAKINAPTEDEATPLHWAVSKGRLAVVKRLLAAKADVDAKDSSHQTALLRAVEAGDETMARVLVEAKADVDASDGMHRSPFTLAVDEGYADLARLMLVHGATAHFRDEQMSRVMITQAAKGHTAMVRFLTEHGVNAALAYRGRTALMAGALAGDRDLAESLIRVKAPVDAVDNEGRTALALASGAGNVAYAEALLKAGADAKIGLKDGTSCLHLAALWDSPALIQLLLANGADVKRVDRNNRGPLDYALLGGCGATARLFAARGARIDLKSANAPELLEAALKLDVVELIRAALSEGWSPDTKFHVIWPALRVAQMCDAKECAVALQQAGALEAMSGLPPLVNPRELDARPKLLTTIEAEDPRDIDAVFPEMTVEVDVVLDERGGVLFPVIHRTPDPRLGWAALQTVANWRFTPITQGGRAACGRFRLPLTYVASTERAIEASAADVPPQVLEQTSPVYPMQFRRSGLEGRVNLRFTIGTDGHTHDVRVVSSSQPEFEAPAMEAVRKWTFKPGQLAGQPVNVRWEVPIVFSLRDD